MRTPRYHLPIAAVLSVLLWSLSAAVPAEAQLTVDRLTQYGTSARDVGWGIAVDSLGQSWVTGSTAGNLGGANAGGDDLFLSRLSASGNVDFTKQRGGNNGDTGRSVALVGGSVVFVGGTSYSSVLDGETGAQGLAPVMRFDTGGTWQATTRSDNGNQIHVLAGNATHLLAAASIDSQSGRGSEAILVKRDSTGAVVWTQLVGSANAEYGMGAAFDKNGNAFLAGFTAGSLTGFTNAGLADLFLARYDASGNRTLLQQFGTSGDDYGYLVEVDVSGNIYLTGSTTGALGGQVNAGSRDGFIMKLDPNGTPLWTRLIGGSGWDESWALGLDASGHI